MLQGFTGRKKRCAFQTWSEKCCLDFDNIGVWFILVWSVHDVKLCELWCRNCRRSSEWYWREEPRQEKMQQRSKISSLWCIKGIMMSVSAIPVGSKDRNKRVILHCENSRLKQQRMLWPLFLVGKCRQFMVMRLPLDTTPMLYILLSISTSDVFFFWVKLRRKEKSSSRNCKVV